MVIPEEIGASKDPISELVKLLAEEREFTSVEIAETLWLALRIEPVAAIVPDELPSSSTTIDEDSDSKDRDTSPPSLPPSPSPSPRANITTPTPKAGVLPPQVLPVWLADPAMLTDPLGIIRALKPLLQQVETGSGRQLDEPATVDCIARTQLWLPILSPEQEPWFDIIMVVDRGSSMHIWQRLVNDLVCILRRYGAFRDLQVFNLEVDRETPKLEDKVLLRSHPDLPGHRPSELIDKRGRRIAMVLSDCAGEYWWNGTLLPMLQDWGKVMPTVVWQMLPEWMWERTALGRGTPVALSNDIPGAANQQLKLRVLKRDVPEDADQRLPAPVVTSEVRDLTNWSLMLAGDRREVMPGFLLPKQGGSVPKAKAIEDIARDRIGRNSSVDSNGDIEAAVVGEIESIARDRVHRFRQLSSPQGRRLAMLLAAAPVITLPVMRLIRDSMLYDAKSPLPVAEVFLSGLLQRLPGQEDIEPDLVQYDFVSKVRDVLLEVLPAVDTIEVINSVSAAVEKRWNQFSNQDFRAFLMNPNIEAPAGLAGLRSFASATADILEQLGGEYASLARQLRQGAGEEAPLFDPVGVDHLPDWKKEILIGLKEWLQAFNKLERSTSSNRSLRRKYTSSFERVRTSFNDGHFQSLFDAYLPALGRFPETATILLDADLNPVQQIISQWLNTQIEPIELQLADFQQNRPIILPWQNAEKLKSLLHDLSNFVIDLIQQADDTAQREKKRLKTEAKQRIRQVAVGLALVLLNQELPVDTTKLYLLGYALLSQALNFLPEVKNHCLMVVVDRLASRKNTYYVKAYLLINTSSYRETDIHERMVPLHFEETGVGIEIKFKDMPRLVKSCIDKSSPFLEGSRYSLTLEFFLTDDLFFTAIDQIKTPYLQRSSTIGATYPILVRSSDRLRKSSLMNPLYRRFITLEQQVQHTENYSLPVEATLLTTCSDLLSTSQRSYSEHNSLAILINEPLPKSQDKRRKISQILIMSGVPIALWIREDAPLRDYQDDLNRLFEGSIYELPERVRQERVKAEDNKEHIGSHLGLMYENQNRRPPDISFSSEF